MEKKARGSFTGSIGFVLATAGSAIGLGNLWRFPYLAAKDGGGLFLLVYLILMLTFGFSLMLTEIALGRKTTLSPLQAYGAFDKRFRFLGLLATIVPIIIFPYYCVIGGWVSKYAATYITGGAKQLYETGAGSFFMEFISHETAPIFWFLFFILLNAIIVAFGVEKGIEKAAKLIMPTLLFLIVGITIFALTLSYTDTTTGIRRTALNGLKIYLIPNFEGITPKRLISIILDASGQMFYSLSVAMGIMVTYGSYCKKDSNLSTAVNRIELFDTGIAILAGMIIIPTVYAFQGNEGLTAAGPSLMFISLPNVFHEMGSIGSIVASIFFLLVLFAALTSSMSILEAITSCLIDRFHLKRPLATFYAFAFSAVVGIIVCLGYNKLLFEIPLPNGETGQILDLLDYISNYLMLPIVALITCIMVGWVCKPKSILDEVSIGMNGKKLYRKNMYILMIRFVAPLLLCILLLQAFNLLSFLD